MSAAEAIHDRIHGPGYCEPPCGLCREVMGLLEDYAHELAEKQRKETRSGTFILRTERPEDPGALIKAMGEHLADLIDPTKESNG